MDTNNIFDDLYSTKDLINNLSDNNLKTISVEKKIDNAVNSQFYSLWTEIKTLLIESKIEIERLRKENEYLKRKNNGHQ